MAVYDIEGDYSIMVYRIDHDGEESIGIDQFGVASNKLKENLKLVQLCELDREAFIGQTICDAFFIKSHLIIIVINTGMAMCRLDNLELGKSTAESELYRLEVDGFKSAHNYRKVYFDRNQGVLHVYSGTEKGFFRVERRITAYSFVDLNDLVADIERDDLDEETGLGSEGYSERLLSSSSALTESCKRLTELEQNLDSFESGSSEGQMEL